MKTLNLLPTVALAAIGFFLSHSAEAKERHSSWQNSRGEGSHSAETQLDRSNQTFQRASATTYANGKSSSSISTVTKEGDSLVKQGQATGPNGNSVSTNKTLTKTDTRTRGPVFFRQLT